MELYNKYRITALDQIFNNKQVIRLSELWVATNSIPHSLLIYGTCGVGKTSLARILAHHVGANGHDIIELNGSCYNGIETARSVMQFSRYRPFSNKAVVFILDEFHILNRNVQEALLKVLEEPPPYFYIFLCTTKPSAIIHAVKSRCFCIRLTALDEHEIRDYINYISGI